MQTNVEIDGHTYAYRTEPRCRVCSSDSRLDVESALAEGLSPERIVETLGAPAGINARGIRAHISRGHLPMNASASTSVEQARSAAISAVIAPLVQGAAANLSFAHAVVDRVRQRLEAGEVEPNVRDGLAAARLIAESETGLAPADEEQWRTEYYFIFENMKEIMTPVQFEDMTVRLREHSREIEAAKRR